MAGPGLLNDGWDIDPNLLATMAGNAGDPTWTPGAAPADMTLAPAIAQPAATMADSGGGFWKGLSDAGSTLGLALGGGIDPSITGEAAGMAGRRALLNFSLAMLANSGPSYTPRNFGQILASGLGAAASANQYTEEQRLKAQQIGATLALKAGQMKIQEYLAGLTGAKAAKELGVAAKVSAAAQGGGDTTPAGVVSPPGAIPEVPEGAYGQGGPDTTPVPPEYLPFYQEASARTGIPVDVLIAQGRQESSFRADARGKAGEIGLGQVKPSTAQAPGGGVAPVDPAKLTDPRTAINFQADYLRSKIPPGTDPSDPAAIRRALIGYNGGGDPNYVANVTRYLSPPTAAAPRTQMAGPGAGAAAAPGGAAAPAPSSTPPSPGTGVVGPPAATPPATVNAAPPTAPLIPRATLAPPDFSDIPGRHASVDATYREQLANTANAMDPAFREKAETEKRAGHEAINAEVANRKAAYAKESAEFDAKQNEAEAKLVAENQRSAAQIAAQDRRDAAERQNRLDVEAAKAKAAIDTAHATNIGHIMAERLKVSGADAEAARQLASKVDQLELVAPVIMQGGPDFIADKHPEVRDVLRQFNAGTSDQWAKWNAQDTWQQVMKQLQVGANAAFKGSVSDYEERIAGASFQTLSQDPQNIPIALGMLRAAINRKQVIDALRNDYASSPQGKANGTAGMEQWVNSQLPGYDPKHPLDPPPLFLKPPPLTAPALRPGTPERAAAEAADTAATKAYVDDPEKARGIPFQLWQTIKGADGKDQRVLGWAVKGPDGRWHTQQFQRGG